VVSVLVFIDLLGQHRRPLPNLGRRLTTRRRPLFGRDLGYPVNIAHAGNLSPGYDIAAVGVLVAAILGTIVFTALTRDINPPSNVERIDPKTLHLSGEFAEQNLGTTVAGDGRVVVRVIATQFMFVPHCLAVPHGRPVTLRFAAPDVVHGLLITGTNVNTMVIPGYVAQVHTRFTRTGDLLMPCHEYCGLGHSQMWATVKVVPEAEFKPGAAPTGGRPVTYARRLTLAHMWFAFAAFAVAAVLGVWQMWVRSPLPAPFLTAEAYFTSVTAHGVAMAYVLPTFVVMGFGYYVAETALARPLPHKSWAWLGFGLGYGAVGLWWGLVVGLVVVALFLIVRVRQREQHGLERIIIDEHAKAVMRSEPVAD